MNIFGMSLFGVSALLIAPAALAAGFVLAGPILAHLVRRMPTERKAFGLMFLLERLQRRVQRRRQMHDRLLLLLRLLALALVVLAAARPELRLPQTAEGIGSTGRVVIVIDDSLSMDQRIGGESALSLARKEGARVARGLPAGVRVAVVTMGGAAQTLVPLTGDAQGDAQDDTEGVAAKIEALQQGYGRTDLHGALVLVREMLGEQPGEVLVLTDEAGPGVVDRAQEDVDWLQGRGTAIYPQVFAPESPQNLVPIEASYGEGLEGGTVSVKVLNYGAEAREVPATVALPDGSPITTFLQLPGATEEGPGIGEGRITVPRQVKGGVASLTVEDDALPLDNRFWFHLPRIGASRVLVVDGDPGSTATASEVYFLERALAPWASAGVAVDVVAPSGVTGLEAGRYQVAFVANVGDPGVVAPKLVEFVRKGGGVVLSMGRNVRPERYNTALGSILPAALQTSQPLPSPDERKGAPLALPDPVAHSFFKPFARSGLEGFQKIRVFSAVQLAPFAEGGDVQTLLKTRDGQPVFVSRNIGTGRVAIWTSTMDLSWSNLPLQNIFLPFIQRMVGWMGGDTGEGGNASRASGRVGDRVEIRLPERGVEAEITGPDGRFVAVDREATALSWTPVQPGPFEVRPVEGPPLAWVAVNLDPAESDVRRGRSIEEARLASLPEQLQDRVPLEQWLVLGGALLLAGAALIGGGRAEPT